MLLQHSMNLTNAQISSSRHCRRRSHVAVDSSQRISLDSKRTYSGDLVQLRKKKSLSTCKSRLVRLLAEDYLTVGKRADIHYALHQRPFLLTVPWAYFQA